MALFPEKMVEKGPTLTPEVVMGRLIHLEAQAHYNHLNTNSFAAHKALDELYSGIGDFKDSVMELILGNIAPKRLGPVSIQPIKIGKNNSDIAVDLCNFAYDLKEWAEENEWCDLENVADEIKALGTKCKYLFTLS